MVGAGILLLSTGLFGHVLGRAFLTRDVSSMTEAVHEFEDAHYHAAGFRPKDDPLQDAVAFAVGMGALVFVLQGTAWIVSEWQRTGHLPAEAW